MFACQIAALASVFCELHCEPQYHLLFEKGWLDTQQTKTVAKKGWSGAQEKMVTHTRKGLLDAQVTCNKGRQEMHLTVALSKLEICADDNSSKLAFVRLI